jgi:predicted MFS family arabinose efflux permease
VAQEQSDTPAQAKPSKMARYTLFMLTIAYALNFVDRQILVILQEPIKLEMGLTDVQLGLLSGFSFALVYITAGLPIAYWADRGNRRNIIALAVTVWSGMTALSGLAGNYTQLLLARIGVGIGEAGGSPPSHAMISDCYPPEKRGTALAIYSMGVHLGILLGFLVGGFVSQAYGWRVAFMAVGIPGVLFAIVFFLTVKEPQRGRWESNAEAAYKPTLKETYRLLKQYPSFWYISAGAGLAAFVGYGTGNFAPSFLMRSHNLDVGQVGVILAIFGGGGGLVGTFLGGYLADRLGQSDKRWYVWVPAIAGTLAIPLGFPYLLMDNTYIAIGVMFFATMAISTYLGPCVAISHAMVPPAMRALASAILFFVINLIGLGLGPVTVGLLSDWLTGIYGSDGLRYAMLLVGIVGILSIAMFFMAGKHLRADMAKRAVLQDA